MSVRDEYVAGRSRKLAAAHLRLNGIAVDEVAVARIASRFEPVARREFDGRNRADPYAYGVPRTSGNVGAISAQRKPANRPASLARMAADPDEE